MNTMNTMNTMSLTQISLKNIQNFFDKYTKSNDPSLIPSEIRQEPRVFASESQLPDLWLKTRSPIDRNKMFQIWEDRERDRDRCRGYKKNGGKKFTKVPLTSPVYFPSVPLVIPEKCREVFTIEKVSVEKVFSQEDKKVSSPIPTAIIRPVAKEDLTRSDILERSWFISFYKDGKFFNYGPMDSFKVHYYLRILYVGMPPEEKEKRNFLVVDSVYDIHFQPDSLYEILTAEIERRNSKGELTKMAFITAPFLNVLKPLPLVQPLTGLLSKNPSVTIKKLEEIRVTKEDKENVSHKANAKFDPNWRKKSAVSDKVATNYSSVIAEENFDCEEDFASSRGRGFKTRGRFQVRRGANQLFGL